MRAPPGPWAACPQGMLLEARPREVMAGQAEVRQCSPRWDRCPLRGGGQSASLCCRRHLRRWPPGWNPDLGPHRGRVSRCLDREKSVSVLCASAPGVLSQQPELRRPPFQSFHGSCVTARSEKHLLKYVAKTSLSFGLRAVTSE